MRVKNYKIWLSILIIFSIGLLFACSIVSRELVELTGSIFDGMPSLFLLLGTPFILALVGFGTGLFIVRLISENLDTDSRKPAVKMAAFTIVIGIGVIFFIVSISITLRMGWNDYANLLFPIR